MQEIAQEENRIPLPAKASSSLRFLIYGYCSSAEGEVDSRVGVRSTKKRNVPGLPAGTKRRRRVPNAGIPEPTGIEREAL
jgi:hypothetical protein